MCAFVCLHVQLKISQPDGQPVSNGGGKTATLQTTVTAQVEQKTTPYPYYYPQTTNFDLGPKTLTVPDNGLIAFALSVPANATSLNIHVSATCSLLCCDMTCWSLFCGFCFHFYCVFS